MSQWIDLTILIDKSYQGYPGDDPLSIKPIKTVDKDGYNLSQITTGMHVGTHMDAYKHVSKHGQSIESIDVNQCIGFASVIRPKVMKGVVSTKDIIEKYRYKNRILILDFSNDMKNKEHDGEDYPRFDMAFTQFLVDEKIDVLGMNLPSFEYNQGDFLTMHQDVLSKGILVIENLCNLSRLSETVELIALPLKIKGLDGSMVRAVARNIKIG